MLDEAGQKILDAAIAYAKAGFTVIPLKGRGAANAQEGKQPIVAWQKWIGKVPSEETLRKWWEARPLSNVALLVGPEAGVLVYDCDGSKGEESLRTLGITRGPDCKTPRGGHYYYRFPESLQNVATTCVKVAEGLDSRGKSGFCVCPPSVTLEGGKYEWTSNTENFSLHSLQDAPEALVNLLLSRTSKQEFTEDIQPGAANWFRECWENGAGSGDRHQMMCKVSSVFASRGLPEDAIDLLMLEWNSRCNPPKQQEAFLDELHTFMVNWQRGNYKSNVPLSSSLKPEALNTFLGNGDERVRWLVEGLIPEESITFLFGYSGLGKSWLTLDLAIEMGRGGGTWLGKTVNAGRVLYVDQESHKGLLRYRFRKLLKGKGIEDKQVDVQLISLADLKLDNRASVDTFKGLLVELQPSLVIADPFLTLHTLDERSSDAMGKLRGFFKEIIADCKTGLLFIDHAAKRMGIDRSAAEMQRGSSEKGAVSDVGLALSQLEGGTILLEQAKSRYGQAMQPLEIKLRDIGDDALVVDSKEFM